MRFGVCSLVAAATPLIPRNWWCARERRCSFSSTDAIGHLSVISLGSSRHHIFRDRARRHTKPCGWLLRRSDRTSGNKGRARRMVAKEPWVELSLSGKKAWEIRSRPVTGPRRDRSDRRRIRKHRTMLSIRVHQPASQYANEWSQNQNARAERPIEIGDHHRTTSDCSCAGDHEGNGHPKRSCCDND
jgi:hypothetical protein